MVRINGSLQMIIWYNGNGASNRSEKYSRFRKEFESVGWRENGPIDEIISAYSDIFKYFQYLFRLIRNNTKLFKVIRIYFNTRFWFRSKGTFYKYLVSFCRSPNIGATVSPSNVIIVVIFKMVIFMINWEFFYNFF